MAVIKIKPTSPGRRGVVKISRNHLHKGEGFAPLLEPQFQQAGRNNNGHITTRHKGGGHKHHYRVVDFRRAKALFRQVERIEYPQPLAHRRWCFTPRRAPLHHRAARARGCATRQRSKRRSVSATPFDPQHPGGIDPLASIAVGQRRTVCVPPVPSHLRHAGHFRAGPHAPGECARCHRRRSTTPGQRRAAAPSGQSRCQALYGIRPPCGRGHYPCRPPSRGGEGKTVKASSCFPVAI